MKRFIGFGMSFMLLLGLNAFVFGQNPPPPPPDGKEGMGKRMPGGPGMRDGKRGKHGRKGGMRGGPGMMGKGHRGGPGGMFGDIEQLDLSDAQKIKLFDLKKKHRAEKEAGREAMRKEMESNQAERQKIHELMMAKRSGTITADQQKELDAFQAKMKAKMEERKKKGEAFHQELLGMLTDAQKQQLKAMHEERMKKMQEMRKNRPMRGPGGPPPGGAPSENSIF